MSDPRYDDRYDNRIHSPYAERVGENAGYAFAGLVAIALVGGLLVWGISGDNRQAANPPPDTTGQSTRPPAAPAPAPVNPSGTTPQRETPRSNP